MAIFLLGIDHGGSHGVGETSRQGMCKHNETFHMRIFICVSSYAYLQD